MATGRDMQITRQIGEHLVVAELGRRGYVAAPFAGNSRCLISESATNSQPNPCPTLTCTGVTVCPAILKRADNWHRVSGRFYCNRGALALLVDQGTTRGKVKSTS